WIEAARWSGTGPPSCSNTVTGMPCFDNARAQTTPTGPAPTTTTRRFSPVLPMEPCRLAMDFRYRASSPDLSLLDLETHLGYPLAPFRHVPGDQSGKVVLGHVDGVNSERLQSLSEFRIIFGSGNLARKRVDDLGRRAGWRDDTVPGLDVVAGI